MNKKFIALALCTATAGAMVTVLATKKAGNSFGTLAGDDCEGYHYAQVDPTLTASGHREFWVCCKHHEISLTEPQDGHYTNQSDDKMVGGLANTHAAYLPALNETDYTRTKTTNSSVCTETWTLKTDENVAFTNTFSGGGFITVNGSSNYYMPYDFNKAYPGVVMTYDSSSKLITWNVTKEGGATIDNATIVLPTDLGDSLLITGEPLTINAKTNSDGLKVEKQTITIDNDFVLQTVNHASTSSKSGFNCGNLIINEGASAKCRDFAYGIFLQSTGDIVVNGDLNFSGTTYNNYAYTGGRELYFDANHSLYLNEEFKTVGGTTPITENTYRTGHLIITANENYDFSQDGVPTSVITAPTPSSEGVALGKCKICGGTVTMKMPKFSTKDYELAEGKISVYKDGSVYDCPRYSWNVDGGDPVYFGVVDEGILTTSVLYAGSSYYSEACLEFLFPNLTVGVVNNELTLTLNGDVDFVSTSGNEIDGALDLNSFDKVTISGSGTLKIKSNQSHTLIAKNLIVNEGTTLSLSGTNYSGSEAYGIQINGSLITNGNVVIDNFNRGIVLAGDCTISSTGSVTITKCTYGFYINKKLTFENSGILNMSIVGNNSSGVGFYNNLNEVNYNFIGDSQTTITVPYRGFSSSDDTKNNAAIRISDNAIFNVTATGGNTTCNGIYNPRSFIVANEDGSQCNAQVCIETNSAPGIEWFGLRDGAMTLTINTTRSVKIWKNSKNTTQSGIKFYRGDFTIKIKTELIIDNFQYGLYFNSTPFNVKSVDCDHKINALTCLNKTGGSYAPSGVADWFKVSE